MDYTASSAPVPAPVQTPTDLGREVRVLRLTVSLTLVALVILAGSLGVYLFRQVSILRRQNDQAAKAASQALQHYKQNIESQAMLFERNLLEFARTNTDIQPRLAKFFPGGNLPAPGPAPAPAPGGPAVPPAAPTGAGR